MTIRLATLAGIFLAALPARATGIIFTMEGENHKSTIWIDGNHLRDRHVVFPFHEKEVDGVRTDVDGKIFVARPSQGQIAIIKPDGTALPPVPLNGQNPSNLTFGGPDGRTVFVTQADGKFVESFRTDRPGREPCLQTQAPGMC